ncbi:DUF262 domain-containing protein [Sorangium sp. So ce1014]|uniref:DUF262 domain-containing protein n=1 Tax=Sorangium sp. So ce1014 TaxID=3133326 RepID=UPI003F600136
MTKPAAKADPSGAPADAPSVRRALLANEAPENRRIPILKVEWTILQLHRRLADQTLILRRPFRPDLDWSPAVQAQLVESVLLRLPLPAFYVAESRDGSMQILDGLQRLLSLFGFLEGKLALTGLRLLPELVGKRFPDLPVRLRRRFEDTPLTVMVLDSDAEPELRLDVFSRLNLSTPPGDDGTREGG